MPDGPATSAKTSLLRSALFWKASGWMAAGLVLWLPFFYALTVPLVDYESRQTEEEAARGQLDSIQALILQTQKDLDAWHEAALESRRQQLRAVVDLVQSDVDAATARIGAGAAPLRQAQQSVLERVRGLRFGDGGYVWVADDDSVLLAHPSPEFQGRSMRGVTDERGTPTVDAMVEGARRDGEGFHSYLWPRLGMRSAESKLAFYRYVPQWHWTVAAGLYLHEVDQEFAQRKAAIIRQLRDNLHDTRIARNGIVALFDGQRFMLVHPDRELEGQDLSAWLDPRSGKPLLDEMMAASKVADGEVSFLSDRAGDRGHYVYDMVAWVHYLPEQDWYLVAAAYVDDLESSGRRVAGRILVAFAIGLTITAAIGFLFVRNLTIPILLLSESARRSARGELAEVAGIRRRDEVGLLADGYNRMVRQLRGYIGELEQRVRERTAEIEQRVSELQNRSREIGAINRTLQMFQACDTAAEVWQVLRGGVTALYPQVHATLLQMPGAGDPELAHARVLDHVDDCWSLRLGRVHEGCTEGSGPRCAHVDPTFNGCYQCIPLTVRGTAFGVLHLANDGANADGWNPRDLERVGRTLADQAALTLANLSMRQRLQDQSIHDPLTGLYNRRYLAEWLQREILRARRDGSSIGFIMVDIDHFKRVNDRYGHEAGDVVLKTVAGVLTAAVRGGDLACRFGGEEFLLVLPGADAGTSRERAEALRRRMELTVTRVHDQEIAVTISLGVALFPAGGATVDEVIATADAALYRAKAGGRNRVECAALPASATPPATTPAGAGPAGARS